MPDVLSAVRANTSNGDRIIFPVSEDIFIYGASAPFYIPNPYQLLNFYGSIAEEPGVDYLPLSLATIAPAVVNEGTGEMAEKSPILSGFRPARSGTRGAVAGLVSGD